MLFLLFWGGSLFEERTDFGERNLERFGEVEPNPSLSEARGFPYGKEMTGDKPFVIDDSHAVASLL